MSTSEIRAVDCLELYTVYDPTDNILIGEFRFTSPDQFVLNYLIATATTVHEQQPLYQPLLSNCWGFASETLRLAVAALPDGACQLGNRIGSHRANPSIRDSDVRAIDFIHKMQKAHHNFNWRMQTAHSALGATIDVGQAAQGDWAIDLSVPHLKETIFGSIDNINRVLHEYGSAGIHLVHSVGEVLQHPLEAIHNLPDIMRVIPQLLDLPPVVLDNIVRGIIAAGPISWVYWALCFSWASPQILKAIKKLLPERMANSIEFLEKHQIASWLGTIYRQLVGRQSLARWLFFAVAFTMRTAYHYLLPLFHGDASGVVALLPLNLFNQPRKLHKTRTQKRLTQPEPAN
jgi:hypothetical protein